MSRILHLVNMGLKYVWKIKEIRVRKAFGTTHVMVSALGSFQIRRQTVGVSEHFQEGGLPPLMVPTLKVTSDEIFS